MQLAAQTQSVDDQPFYLIRRDASGGQNTRQHATMIGENQFEKLQNIDLNIFGERVRRRGSTLIGDDVGADSIVALHNYIRQGYNDVLLMVEDTNLQESEAEADWAVVKSDFTADDDVGIVQAKESSLTPNDVVFVNVGDSNWFRLHKDSTGSWDEQDLGNTAGTGSDSPPQSTVGTWYRNRFWVLKNDQLYFSDAYDDDYSNCFDTVSNVFRIPVGEERGIAITRDTGMVVLGEEQIWGLAPSITPAATDASEPLVTNHGCVSKKGWTQVGDAIFYFAQDGFRELSRTIQDKLQSGVSYPLSYQLKDAYDEISWGNISKLSMVYFDNRVLIAVPTGSDSFDTWVYYPATTAWTVWTGLSPRCWAKYKVLGDERLYYGKHEDGTVYRMLYGWTDEGTTTTNGTNIDMEEISRNEDVGQPMVYKRGGEVEVKMRAIGDYDINVAIEFDENGYNVLGTLNLAGGLVTFPTTFPVIFGDNIKYGKFHLDQYERWRTAQLKIYYSSGSGTSDVAILEHNITGFIEEYETE